MARFLIRFILTGLVVCAAASMRAQTITDPALFPALTDPDNSNFEFYSRKTGVNRKASFDNVRKRMCSLVKTSLIGYTPTPTGNSSDLGYIVANAAGLVWYIDGLGNAKQLNAVPAGSIGPTEIASTAVAAGTYGDATHVGQFTVDADGRITNASNVLIDTTGLGGGDDWGSQVVEKTGSTLSGNGTTGSPLKVATGGIGSTEIANGSVAPADLSFTATNTAFQISGGNIEITDGAGTLSIALGALDNQTAAEVSATATAPLTGTNVQDQLDEIAGLLDGLTSDTIVHDETLGGQGNDAFPLYWVGAFVDPPIINSGTALSPLTLANSSINATYLASTTVTPGSYTNTNLTVDADGRITAASNGSGGSSGHTIRDDGADMPDEAALNFVSTSTINAVATDDAGNGETEIAMNIPAGAVGATEIASTAVSPGSYGSTTQIPIITVDADGRLTSASQTAITAGSVTSFSSGNLSPLFTTSVSNPTTTPNQTFTLTNAAATTVFGNFASSFGAPQYNASTADGQFLVQRSSALTFGNLVIGDVPVPSTRIPYGSSGGAMTTSTVFTWDNSNGTLSLLSPSGGSPSLIMDNTANGSGLIFFKDGGNNHWIFGKSSTDNFLFNRYNSSGVFQATDFQMEFSTGNVLFNSLKSGSTAPTTSGTTKTVITDSNGRLSFATTATGGHTIRDDGSNMTQRGALNFVSTSTVNAALTDDAGNDETEVALNVPANGITATEIATDAVGAAEIGASAVGAPEIAADAVGSSELQSTSVTPGSYTFTNLTVDSDGRLTAASNGAPSTVNNYTANGTFTVNGAKSIEVICIGGGGGGGSGRKGAAGSVRCGGGGGSAGSYSFGTFSISDLGNPTTINVTVGAAGTGGAAITANSTNGNPGTAGGETFCDVGGAEFITAQGGNFGAGGTATGGTGGAATIWGDFLSVLGGSANATGGTGLSASDIPGKGGGSAGGGGGITAADAAQTGGAGGKGFYTLRNGGFAGGIATSGGNGDASGIDGYGGGGGGGGGSRITAGSAGSGGTGARGAGGGGGGAALNSTSDSGAGGNGGAGFVRIIAHY